MRHRTGPRRSAEEHHSHLCFFTGRPAHHIVRMVSRDDPHSPTPCDASRPRMRARFSLLAPTVAVVYIVTAPSTQAAPLKAACIGEHTTHSHAFPATNREAQLPAGRMAAGSATIGGAAVTGPDSSPSSSGCSCSSAYGGGGPSSYWGALIVAIGALRDGSARRGRCLPDA